MNFFKSKQNFFTLFCILIISVLIVLATIFFTQHNCFMDDDEHYALINGLKYSDIFKSLTFSEHGGGYFGYFLCKFMCFLVPLKLGIHPADWLCSPVYNSIKGLFIVSVLLVVSKFITAYHKSKALFILAFFSAFSWLIFSFLENIASIFFFNYNFYRYFFSIIFYAYLMYFIFKNINVQPNGEATGCDTGLDTEQKINKYEQALACFCAYNVGTSSEMLFISAFVLYIFLLCIKIFSKNYKINKRVFIPFMVLTCTIIFFITSPGFHWVADSRGFLQLNLSFDYLADYVLDFTKHYFIIYFKNIYLYWIICLMLIISTYAFYKNSFKNLIFPILLQISVFCAYYTLILCTGPSGYVTNDCSYFISHTHLIFLFRMIMLIPLFLYISNILEQSKNDKKIIYISVYAMFTFSSIYITCANMVNPLIKDVPYNVQIGHELNYKTDKLIRFQLLNNEKPVIPEEWADIFTMWYKEWNWDDYCRYFMWVYKDKRILNAELKRDNVDEILNKYYAEGGIYTEEEIKELNFSRLKNDDYILNKGIKE